MIKNEFRKKELNKEKQKHRRPHLKDQYDNAPHGKFFQNRPKYPKQWLLEDHNFLKPGAIVPADLKERT